MRPKVFLSAGRTETPQQEAFVAAVTQCLQDDGFDIVRTQWSSEQPLKPIWRKMRECAGTAVIAFERLHFERGVEFRGAAKEKPLEHIAFPTVWNQIEATMAYTLGHPLLVVVEDNLRDEGLLERRYDWYVQRVPLDPAVFSQREFRGVMTDWKERVIQGPEKKSRELAPDPESITVGQLLGSLKPAQLWGVVATIVTVLAAVFTAAFQLGQLTAQR